LTSPQRAVQSRREPVGQRGLTYGWARFTVRGMRSR